MTSKDHQTANKPKHVLSLPALPIIQSAVVAIAPLFDGKRNDSYINLLLAFIRGEKTRAEVDELLAEKGINADNHPGFSLFAGGPRNEQAVACASYIASTVLIDPNLNEFLEPTGEVNEKTKKTEFKINHDRLTQSLSTKLAVAITAADIFTLIAKELQLKPNLTLDGCRNEATRLFMLLAPTFLERIQQHFVTDLHYNLAQIENGQFTFTSSNGYLFNFDQSGLTLQLAGINWYGHGQLLGQDYRVDIAYFSESINELLK